MTTPASDSILLDAFLPRISLAQNVLLIVAGSLLVALCAQISLPLPFSPVPVTGQTFAVLLLGATYGPRRSAAALLLYLAEGAAGLPVFAPDGLPGLARLLGPTGGYLLAFPAAAFLLGWLVERSAARRPAPSKRSEDPAPFAGPDPASGGGRRGWWSWLGAVLAAEAVIFVGGLVWLQLLTGSGWREAIVLGLLPFLPGELVKVALLAACLPASWWALRASTLARRQPRA